QTPRHFHGIKDRHRRPPERRQEYLIQRINWRRQRRGRQLPLLHDRAERRRRECPGRAPEQAVGDQRLREDGSYQSRIRGHRRFSQGRLEGRRSRAVHAIEQTQLRRKYRVDGLGRPKFDFRTGLGNQFLANIRECDAIVHMVRCFENDDVIHVDASIDPVRDVEVIELELALADLQQVEKRMERAGKDKKTGKAPPEEMDALTKLQAALDEGKQARDVDLSEKELEAVKGLNLLTIKPVIYACNVADEDLAEGNAFVEAIKKRSGGESVVVVSAQVESELVSLDSEDRDEFLDALGVTLEGCGLRALVRTAYDTLGLITYYTSGPTESRAWTIREGWLAPQAAGVIHGDFERGFIKAETVGYEALVDAGDEKAAKEAGLMRSEGKEYVFKDGDVMLFRFNV
ncbi:unnamed protein product, partial [Pelagomonas calceolata]